MRPLFALSLVVACGVSAFGVVESPLAIQVSHHGNFLQGQSNASYLIRVSNPGTTKSTGLVWPRRVSTMRYAPAHPNNCASAAVRGSSNDCSGGAAKPRSASALSKTCSSSGQVRSKGFTHRALTVSWSVLVHNLWVLARMQLRAQAALTKAQAA